MPQHKTSNNKWTRPQKIIATIITTVALAAAGVAGVMYWHANRSTVNTSRVAASTIADITPASNEETFPAEDGSTDQGLDEVNQLDKNVTEAIKTMNVGEQAKTFLNSPAVQGVDAQADWGAITFTIQVNPDTSREDAQRLADSLADWAVQQYQSSSQWQDTWKDDPSNGRVHVNATTGGDNPTTLATAFHRFNDTNNK